MHVQVSVCFEFNNPGIDSTRLDQVNVCLGSEQAMSVV